MLDTTSDETPEGEAIQGLKDFVVCVCEREKLGSKVGLLEGLLSSLVQLLLHLVVVGLSLGVVDLLDVILLFNLASNLGDKSIDDNQLSIPPFSAFTTFLL